MSDKDQEQLETMEKELDPENLTKAAVEEFNAEWKQNIIEIRKINRAMKSVHTTIMLCYGAIAVFIGVALFMAFGLDSMVAMILSLVIALVFLFIHRVYSTKAMKLKKQMKKLLKENERFKKQKDHILAQ